MIRGPVSRRGNTDQNKRIFSPHDIATNNRPCAPNRTRGFGKCRQASDLEHWI